MYIQKDRGKEMSIKVNNHYYSFIMDTNVPFGSGRYDGSSLGNFEDTGWFYDIHGDKDISSIIGHLAYARIDKKELINEFTKKPKDFSQLKEDLIKSDLSRFVDIVLGWRHYEVLTDLLYDELDNEVEENEITRDEADKIVNELTGEEVNKMASDVTNLMKNDIIASIKNAENLQELFFTITNDNEWPILETAIDIVVDYVAGKVYKIRHGE
jgi:hypothetical protein